MNRRNFLKGFLASGAVVALAPLVPVVLPTAEATYINLDEMLQNILVSYRRQIAENICGGEFYPKFLRGKPHIMSDEQMEEYFNKPYRKSELMVIR